MRLSFVLAAVIGLFGIASAQAANPIVVLDTTYGTIKIELFEDQAPNTVKNFLGYVDSKHFDGLIFHRVIKNFMVQAGGFEPGYRERKAKDPIKNEPKLSNKRGTLAMGQVPNNPDSATSEFYINVVDNLHLDADAAKKVPGYTVFGRVIEGMDVVDKIAAVKTENAGGHEGMPIEDIVIKSAKRAAK